jgi:uncharacterized glyoxalase superfamily protein PhnB
MMKNRSAVPCAVTPVVAYPDVAAAVAWLEAALGFRVRLRVGSHRVQLWFGSGCVIAAEAGADDEWATKSSTLLRVAHEDEGDGNNLDALCERAVAHGARLLYGPETHPYGERQATLQDFAGHLWTLTQTIEDVDPAAWGGTAENL